MTSQSQPLESKQRLRSALFAWALLLFVGLVFQVGAQSPSVKAELIIPPAETYVLGDPTLLYWRFQNTGAESLGFMWEGCCRLNGRLNVKRGDEAMPLIPPGQALAHMFAKAERLDPGKSRDFDTRLSDWVHLSQSGSYELSGRYTGVLPTQQPQVPRGLALWREAAITPPIQVSLISPQDYLKERSSRESRRGLSMTLSGPARMAVIKAAPLKLEIRNQTQASQKLAWPQCMDVWLLDPTGRRVANVSTEVESPYEDIVIPAGGSVVREIPFGTDRLEGQSFGDYSVFIDLRPGSASAPRVPSTTHSVRWELSTSEVTSLLGDASETTKSRVRNPSLTLLRVHVADIGPALLAASTSSANGKVQTLARELGLASCLKPVAPIPGNVSIAIKIVANGSWQIATQGIAKCVANVGSSIDQLKAVLKVRRHLGWQIGIEMQPESSTPLDSIFNVANEIGALRDELYQSPQIRIQHAGAQVPCRLIPQLSDSGEQPILQLTQDGRMLYKPGGAAPRELRRSDELEAEIAAKPDAFALVPVAAPASMRLAELVKALDPLIKRGAQIDLLPVR